jgi:hypothetical protein
LRAGIDDYCLPIKKAPDQELFFVLIIKIPGSKDEGGINIK